MGLVSGVRSATETEQHEPESGGAFDGLLGGALHIQVSMPVDA